MVTVINEDQLASTEVRNFFDVVAVKPGDRNGVEVWRARQIAPFVSPHKESAASEQRVLFIEVPDPDDQVVIDRLRLACMNAWSKR